MYKIGDKFIVEIDSKMMNKKEIIYGIKNLDPLVFDENGLDRLEKYEDDNIKKYAAVGAYFLDLLERPLDFVDSKEKAEEILIGIKDVNYEKGLSDAWEAAKKICLNPADGGIGIETIGKIFGETPCTVMKRNTPQEAIDKLKIWEEKQEIKVGDVIDVKDMGLLVVTHDFGGGIYDCLVIENLTGYTVTERNVFKKTGKHIDLTKIFKELEV